MELKGRLKLIADKTPTCKVICDVGTDHAYVPIYLALNQKCTRAIAADVKEGPLKAAIENIRQYDLEGKIESRLGDGLAPIGYGEAEAIIIAGMGGALIGDILHRGFEKAQKANVLILQPMNAVEELREWLYKNGFEILDEELTREGEKIYDVLLARWTGNKTEYSLIDLFIGRKLVEKRDPLLGSLLERKIVQAKQVLLELSDTTTARTDIVRKYEYLLGAYAMILQKLD